MSALKKYSRSIHSEEGGRKGGRERGRKEEREEGRKGRKNPNVINE